MNNLLINIKGITSYLWLDFHEFIFAYIVFLAVSVGLGFVFIRFWKKESLLKLLTVNLVLFLFLLVHLLYGLEIYYRYIFDATDNTLQIKTMQRWIDRHVRINALSFRNDHFFSDKDPKELRLAAIGDSYTYGYGIENENDRYSNLLEKRLSATCAPQGSTVKVYNMARPGMNTREELEILKMAQNYKVDGIILGYTFDDARSNRTALHTNICYNRIFSYRHNPLLNWLLQKSFALEYLYVRAYNLFNAREFTQTCWTETFEALYRDPEIWIRHLQELKNLIDYTRENNLGLAVVIFPNIVDLGEDYSARDIHQNVATFFKANNIPVIDLLDVYAGLSPDDILVSRRDFHANELGHSLAAEAIYETINPEPWAQCKNQNDEN
ncbi:MAG: SGNH/GDSL hydrolase family protein [Candidatus Chisholmbacteria bacterium]|nr:SGNH/GDSL hydrolase family protein [Candidatus Chisholmbacteria bacterium]